MKWSVYTSEDIGISREVKKFAFFPVKINGEVRWFEYVVIYQQLRYDEYHKINWINVKFLN